MYDLHWTLTQKTERRTQGVVPTHYFVQRSLEGGDIQNTLQAHGSPVVVRGHARVQLIQHPQSLLGERRTGMGGLLTFSTSHCPKSARFSSKDSVIETPSSLLTYGDGNAAEAV